MHCTMPPGILIYLVCLLNVAHVVYSQETPEIRENVVQQCNTTVRQGDGVIVSPNFTATYPNNLHCWWTIIVEPDRIVTLTFGHFNIEAGVNCQYDSVSVFNGPTSEQPMLGKFCGPFRPGQQVSTSNKMHVRMDTDASNGRSGFYAVFLSATPTLATEGSCGGLLTSTEGSFYSPNYPDSDYPPGVTCSWRIRADEDRVIRLTFKEFDIEESNGCKYDSLVMYAGWTFSDKTKYIGKFCGGIEALPSQIVSPGNELFVTFISDASGFGRGFVADYITERSVGVPESEVKPTTTTTSKATTTTTTTTTTSIPTSTTQPYVCPSRCPSRIKLKAAMCTSSYIIAIKVTDVRSLARTGRTSAQILKAFKLGSMPSSSQLTIQLNCPRCFKMSRAGSYLVVGNTISPFGVVIKPGDFVTKFKDRKHTKQVAKLIKRCKKKKNARRGRGKKRAAGKRKRNSSLPAH